MKVCCPVLLLVFFSAQYSYPAERYAVVITGASAGDTYAQKYGSWRAQMVATLRQKFQYPDDHCLVLTESGKEAVGKSTRENVRRLFSDLRGRLSKDDLLFVLLIGHGTTEDDEAKFNLVGPDLSSGDWADLLKPIPGRLVFIDTTGASSPFMHRLAAPGRIVLTATDSPAQQFETIFPEFFIKAFDDPAADVDKNDRVSVWEAFSYASAAVRRWYEQHGQLPTERAVLDDNGDGVGREAQNPGPDGELARVAYFAPESGRVVDSDLAKRRSELERRLEDLRLRKASSTDPTRYDAEIEAVLLEIARVSRQLQTKP